MPLSYAHLSGFQLYWEDAGTPSGHEVEHYQLVVSTSADLSSPVINSGVYTTGCNIGTLSPDTTYFYKVTAVNWAGEREWSDGIVSGQTDSAIAYIGTPNGAPIMGDSGHPYATLQSGQDASFNLGLPIANLVVVSGGVHGYPSLNLSGKTKISAINSADLTAEVKITKSAPSELYIGQNTSQLKLEMEQNNSIDILDGESVANIYSLKINPYSNPGQISNFSFIGLLSLINLSGAAQFNAPDGSSANGTHGLDGAPGDPPDDGQNGSPGGYANNGTDGANGINGIEAGTFNISNCYIQTAILQAGNGGPGQNAGNGGNAIGGDGGDGGDATGIDQDGGDGGLAREGGIAGDGGSGGNGGNGGNGAIINLLNCTITDLYRQASIGGPAGSNGIGGLADGGFGGNGGAPTGTGSYGIDQPDGSDGSPGDAGTGTPLPGASGSLSSYNDLGGNTITNDYY